MPQTEPPAPDALSSALAELAELRAEVAALSEAQDGTERSWKTWIAAAGTASVTLLAFLIPSVQEQWDRLHQRAAFEEYREIAHELMSQRRFHAAEQTLAHALELAAEPRLDLERERLIAKTSEVNSDPAWSGSIEDGLEESGFSLLGGMQAGA